MRRNYEIYSLIGKNIRNLRKNVLNKKQWEFAADINKSVSFIKTIENQKGELGISIDTLYDISKAYNLDINVFFEGFDKLMKKND